MAQRGRKSAESQALAAMTDAVRVERPDAPYDLTDEQASEWRRVVSAKDADHFTAELWGMLADYCRHTVEARHIAQLIESCKADQEAFDLLEYDRLCKMRERETRAAAAMAIKVGITNTEDRKAKARRAKKTVEGKLPWQK